ncbi:1110_t:CDS:2 [Gigaspora margarita]|uniref:1110_t:CDS:1 n=1 Tax=Gigaspora margarita TaxID=4874 RepID=A0ABN7V0C1_GIGMA|nr:1110_t:CDS:2 [Gigaspora margarita]
MTSGIKAYAFLANCYDSVINSTTTKHMLEDSDIDDKDITKSNKRVQRKELTLETFFSGKYYDYTNFVYIFPSQLSLIAFLKTFKRSELRLKSDTFIYSEKSLNSRINHGVQIRVQYYDAKSQSWEAHQKTGSAIFSPMRQVKDMATFFSSPHENSAVISSGNRTISENNALDLERIINELVKFDLNPKKKIESVNTRSILELWTGCWRIFHILWVTNIIPSELIEAKLIAKYFCNATENKYNILIQALLGDSKFPKFFNPKGEDILILADIAEKFKM